MRAGICRLCFASETANGDRGFTSVQNVAKSLKTLAGLEIPENSSQQICSQCESHVEVAILLVSRIQFCQRIWDEASGAQPVTDLSMFQDDLSLNCHMCGQCFAFENLLEHISKKHQSHSTTCDACQLLLKAPDIQIVPPETNAEIIAIHDEVEERINDELLKSVEDLPDMGEEDRIEVDEEEEEEEVEPLEDSNFPSNLSDIAEELVEDTESAAEDPSASITSTTDSSESRRYFCPVCSKSYVRSDKLRSHTMKAHQLQLGRRVAHLTKPPVNSKEEEQQSEVQHTCNWCGFAFYDLGEFNEHISTHEMETEAQQPYHCEHCGRSFSRSEQLKHHLEKFHPEVEVQEMSPSKFTCPICVVSYTRLQKLDQHLLTHDATPFHCPRCDEPFATRRVMRSHESSCTVEHREELLTCDECPKFFTSERMRQIHKTQIHTETEFACLDCENTFDSVSSLAKHRRLVHEKKFECPICQKSLSRQDKLEAHMKCHDEFNCRECSAKFDSRRSLKCHEQTEHPDQAKPFKCEQCYTSYKTLEKLQQHQAEGHSEDGYKCDHCDQVFETKAKLKSHSYKHKKKLCGFCGKWLHNSFAAHMRRHQGIKAHKCSVCQKEFLRNCDLTAHFKTHTGEKNFACDVCGRAFSRPYKLTVHKRTHTGDRPYKCDWENCNKTFAQSFDLTLHMRRHLGNKPFACPCGESFILSSLLKKHQKNCNVTIVDAKMEQEDAVE